MPWEETDLEIAWISLTLLAVARATRNRVFLVRSRSEELFRGSNADDLRKSRTKDKSQGGTLEGTTGRSI